MAKFTLWFLCLPVLLASCATVGPGEPAKEGQPSTPVQAPTPAARARPPSPTKAVVEAWPPLRERIAASLGDVPGVTVRTGDDGGLHVEIPSAEGFSRDSDQLQASLTAALDRVTPKLAEHPQTSVQIVGHTDSMGSELYNLRLSIRRAEAVMEYLRQRGIALVRLSADGRGESEPIADNASATERMKNRRVELVIRPLEP